MKNACSIGTDIVDVKRIERLIRGKRFVQKIFSREEILYCKPKKNSAQHFAVRFAAKEAVWKALGSILNGKGIAHREICVERAESGKPLVKLSHRLKNYEKKISLSLSHTKDFAIAVAIYQK